jgi:hypothetical protein
MVPDSLECGGEGTVTHIASQLTDKIKGLWWKGEPTFAQKSSILGFIMLSEPCVNLAILAAFDGEGELPLPV